MTKPPSIKTAEIDKYADLDLHQLEIVLKKFNKTLLLPLVKLLLAPPVKPYVNANVSSRLK